MTIISKFNYSGISDNKDITDIFDFDAFLAHTKINTVVSNGSTGTDNKKINTFITKLITGYYASDIKNFLDNDTLRSPYDTDVGNISKSYLNVLFSACYDLSFIPYIKSISGFTTVDIPLNMSLTTALINIFNSSIDWSDLDTVESQMKNLDNGFFMFGTITGNIKFNAGDFKNQVVPKIMEFFYPMIYYLHILKLTKNATDFKYKRAYILIKYVFVYYTFMTLFLLVFADQNKVAYFKSDLNMSNADLMSIKYKMVYVMDGILTLLQNENILDVDGSGSVSSITTYYNQIKDMSNKNVTGSNTLNETKDVALLMQNNLTNYSNNEVVTYDELRRTKVYLIVTIVIMLFIIGIIIGLILMKSYKFVYIVSGIVLLAIAINATIAILRSQNII
jgi:hypothetical protein